MAYFYQAIQHVSPAWPSFWYCCHGNGHNESLNTNMPNPIRGGRIFHSGAFFLLRYSYPLLNIPLPGTIPTKVILPYETQTDSIKSSWIPTNAASDINDANKFENISLEHPPFAWANNEPFVYIQQIVLRSSVMPWHKNLLLTDAYRGPLYEIFKLLEIVRNHEDETR